jgi:hypothetical protein
MKPGICLLITIGLLVGLRQGMAQVSFAPVVNYSVSQIATLTAADINGVDQREFRRRQRQYADGVNEQRQW